MKITKKQRITQSIYLVLAIYILSTFYIHINYH